MLVHSKAGAAAPLELQNKSMVVHGSIRVLTEHCISPGSFHVRAIQAEIDKSIVNGSVGWYTMVRPVSQDTLLRDVVRELQPFVRIQILMQDPPTAWGSNSTSELLSPRVVLL